MPLHKVVYLQPNTKLYLWKISEDYNTLFREVRLKDSSLARLEGMKSESHQKGFLAVRMILQHLEYTDFDLLYDEFGKPHLKPQGCSIKDLELSISHSHDFSAIVISEQKVGLDLEQLKDKTLKIAPRFMDISHLENLSTEDKIKKATVIWGIKESIFKLKNEIGISFSDHISETAFTFDDKITTATLKFNNKEENFKIRFDQEEDYIFVCAFEAVK
ncbi:4'-phosphopantetheinyl transferase family protein [Flavobacterium aquatile]|uniref:4-phosphopantetheinyl transferase n=1 Tax=Flavobacterium aquatile LMG 4008 = ATCC 11947 TaxID=1453498 RepID=A0A095SWV1_9FLAO|nr:4'-phosphopantetheinyl transferase superfamily protein [Flavobacterium aquatile]KGD69146.1 4-phosphopantetheinyl transferase [Flavobacterium aquatile LMG 4008 = ATCC 11947]OXA65855.1 4-phosphopantetheinyl transferase [Flavobacterium aquatile LMG 4008 = ATCC 11947]GEC77998.1 4'-phosphopantetheinyl transferase [Flavobacterium aquatile]